MRKYIKMGIGLLLLPVCYSAGATLWRVIQSAGGSDRMWIPLMAGALCWGVIYLLLPRPLWIYVVGHELTHAIWTWAFGGSVKRIKVSSKGGHVVISKSNFLIALAPYFFPLYAIVVVLVFLLARMLFDWSTLQVWFHLLLGAAYAFHLTLTGHVLKSSQSDITDQGYVFSAAIIFLGNIFILLIAIPLLASNPPIATVFHWWWQATFDCLVFIRRFLP